MFAYTLKIAKQKRKLPINDMMMCAYLLVLFKVTKISLCRNLSAGNCFLSQDLDPFSTLAAVQNQNSGKMPSFILKKNK